MERAERLIAELAGALVPVRRVPPLRRVALGLLLLWSAMGAVVAWWPGLNAVGNPGFLPTFVALAVAASGGALAALALCVPGRGESARLGLWVCAAGALGLLALVWHQGFPPASLDYLRNGLRYDGLCVGIAIGLAFPVWAGILEFARRGFALQPGAVAFLASVASASAGAALVHALCAEGCAEHALGAHGMAPLWGVGVLTLPALWLLRTDRGNRSV